MTAQDASSWIGRELGSRRVAWDERDVMLFALAVGARPDQLDLVFERDLRVLPTFGLSLAQWAPDVLGDAGAFDVGKALHGSQRMNVRAPLPPSGGVTLNSRVSAVWDKGRAAIFDVTVDCELFEATWSIFAPGQGGFGGDRGPSSVAQDGGDPSDRRQLPIASNSALLYRLSGDRHHIHVDPEAARGIGQPRPILHGLATLSAATLVLADIAGAHPCDLMELGGRFSSPVFPGESVDVLSWPDGAFRVETPRGVAIDGGRAVFATP
ncbi:MaoC/PaaZ C-terminal domain-containing protein [Rhodococcus sp. P1Y]|uniref:MaoC/PaaZ C-terminal domain-containing protein n=1 Tax=Rhodococcus sp. P1Y TaxID=1302308 RepID=UPI001F430701|nr:MaoC/PaaZ C-terminal domain-containing protein [Rhodococcus sp. P1Y]